MAVITFYQKYHQTELWYEKCIILEIYHLVKSEKDSNWKIENTANDFGISIGQASENLNLANALHKDADLINCKSRQKALDRMRGQ